MWSGNEEELTIIGYWKGVLKGWLYGAEEEVVGVRRGRTWGEMIVLNSHSDLISSYVFMNF